MAIDMRMVRSRRSLLTAALAGMAGAAAATMAGAQRVLAAGDDGTPVAVAGGYTDARHTTVISNQSNDQTVFQASSLFHGGTAVRAYSDSGIGVLANSDEDYGVFGYTNAGEGVFGRATSGTGIHGVVGLPSNGTPHYPAAVLGEAKLRAGVSILGNNYATKGIAIGVQGTSDSPTGAATIGWARNGGTGVSGVAGAPFPKVPPKTGVYAKGPAGGRGVVAAGGAAQVRLVPSRAATHPSSGQAGDLFLDKSHRLWLCKGDTIWAKLG